MTNYNIKDINQDGFINEADAAIMYPQGHGDAWGQYLTALTKYYELLRHPNYTWVAAGRTGQRSPARRWWWTITTSAALPSMPPARPRSAPRSWT